MAPTFLTQRWVWMPAILLAVGCALNLVIQTQRSMPLAAPLATIASSVDGHQADEIAIDPEQAKIAGASAAIQRLYVGPDSSYFTVYVGYYDRQRQGKTIHSPKNCLPGAGWEPLHARRETLTGASGATIRVNRIVIANKQQRALVYYWYQGRGRTESNEYRVKLDLIRDSALKRRSEEALVRIIIPLRDDGFDADAMAIRLAQWLHAELGEILPT